MKWWVSNHRFTVQADTRGGVIIWTAPIARRFIGQPLRRLVAWIPGTHVEELFVMFKPDKPFPYTANFYAGRYIDLWVPTIRRGEDAEFLAKLYAGGDHRAEIVEHESGFMYLRARFRYSDGRLAREVCFPNTCVAERFSELWRRTRRGRAVEIRTGPDKVWETLPTPPKQSARPKIPACHPTHKK